MAKKINKPVAATKKQSVEDTLCMASEVQLFYVGSVVYSGAPGKLRVTNEGVQLDKTLFRFDKLEIKIKR